MFTLQVAVVADLKMVDLRAFPVMVVLAVAETVAHTDQVMDQMVTLTLAEVAVEAVPMV